MNIERDLQQVLKGTAFSFLAGSFILKSPGLTAAKAGALASSFYGPNLFTEFALTKLRGKTDLWNVLAGGAAGGFVAGGIFVGPRYAPLLAACAGPGYLLFRSVFK